MIILREPEVVRGDVPGLLCRGMPTLRSYSYPGGNDTRGVWCEDEPDPTAPRYRVDWSHPAALDCALRWLADRGHACHWMRPRVYGGCIDDHGDLPAGTVSAILVARSVLEVAAGRPPVVDLLVETCWGTAGCVPGITRYWMRSKRDNAGKYCADVGRRRRSRVRIDERPARRADALSDGCALLVAGGVGLSHLPP